ncbi:MAG TPA: ATP-binding protein [Phycisphaerae bacterium]|nr:ATP-binding protein [Phycisphaerae bacterium]
MNKKKEFLADVSSFANASGGDIIYGIKEAVDTNGKKTGEPEEVIPIQNETSDTAKLRCEQIIINSIAPRVRVYIEAIRGWGNEGNGFVLLIRIPKSFAAPHMVTYKNTSRFFSRNSAGKYPLDVGEIRTAFTFSESLSERVKRFRQERVGNIIAGETPISLPKSPVQVLHIIPLTAFSMDFRLDSQNMYNQRGHLRPPGSGGWDHRLNLDGLITYGKSCYCQLYRSGIIEGVDAAIVNKISEQNHIASTAFEQDIIYSVKDYFQAFKELRIPEPAFVMMSLLGVKGRKMYLPKGNLSLSIDRDSLFLPDILVEDYGMNADRIMKPIFDALWNACGLPNSWNYDEAGNWSPR